MSVVAVITTCWKKGRFQRLTCALNLIATRVGYVVTFFFRIIFLVSFLKGREKNHKGDGGAWPAAPLKWDFINSVAILVECEISWSLTKLIYKPRTPLENCSRSAKFIISYVVNLHVKLLHHTYTRVYM